MLGVILINIYSKKYRLSLIFDHLGESPEISGEFLPILRSPENFLAERGFNPKSRSSKLFCLFNKIQDSLD